MPLECASMRSIARCVLPVLVGPSTAVTPAPRARTSRAEWEENDIDINNPADSYGNQVVTRAIIRKSSIPASCGGFLVKHDLFRKPVSIPDRGRGHAFRDHALRWDVL